MNGTTTTTGGGRNGSDFVLVVVVVVVGMGKVVVGMVVVVVGMVQQATERAKNSCPLCVASVRYITLHENIHDFPEAGSHSSVGTLSTWLPPSVKRRNRSSRSEFPITL